MEIDEIFGETRSVLSPTKSALYGCPAGANSRWLDMAWGQEHTAAVASDGSLFTWGANEFGQLGDGTETSRNHPRKVKLLQNELVISVSCGAHCNVAIAEPRENDGTISSRKLWVWGQNQGSNDPHLFWGAFPPNRVIRQVSCGDVHDVALSEDGLLQTWDYDLPMRSGETFFMKKSVINKIQKNMSFLRQHWMFKR